MWICPVEMGWRRVFRLVGTVKLPSRAVRTFFVLAVAGALIAAAMIVRLQWQSTRLTSADQIRANSLSTSKTLSHSTGGVAGPEIELTPDGELARVRHKDAAGLLPLEKVITSDGVITIQRTFSEAGTLLKEQAFLNGRSVPVPP